jgi:hypothetical protein
MPCFSEQGAGVCTPTYFFSSHIIQLRWTFRQHPRVALEQEAEHQRRDLGRRSALTIALGPGQSQILMLFQGEYSGEMQLSIPNFVRAEKNAIETKRGERL